MSAELAYTPSFPVPSADGSAVAAGTIPGRVEHKYDLNGLPRKEKLLYIPSALQAKLTLGAPYYMGFSGTDTQNPQAVSLAGNATSGIVRQLVILKDNQQRTGTAPSTGSLGWFTFWGYDSVLVDGTTAVAAGDYLTVNSQTISGALQKEASGQATTTVGIAQAAQAAASAVLTEVFLLGPNVILR